jgi:hypothetical protein
MPPVTPPVPSSTSAAAASYLLEVIELIHGGDRPLAWNKDSVVAVSVQAFPIRRTNCEAYPRPMRRFSQLEPPRVRSVAAGGLVRQSQRSATGTSPSTLSMCAPHPAHVGRLQILHVTRRHMDLTLGDDRQQFRASDLAECGARESGHERQSVRCAKRREFRLHPVSKVVERWG